jgi:hypothetical protein
MVHFRPRTPFFRYRRRRCGCRPGPTGKQSLVQLKEPIKKKKNHL